MENLKKAIVRELLELDDRAQHSALSISDFKDAKMLAKTLHYLSEECDLIAEIEAKIKESGEIAPKKREI